MQKKLIALAVAGLVSAPVFAQSAVTVYGRIDMGYANTSGNEAPGGNGNKSSFESGMLAPNFIGFKGVEDLGNGLKVGFDFQTRLNTDRNEQRDFVSGTGNASRRDSFLFVESGFGTVRAGRLTTPQDALVGSVDPMRSSAINGYGTTWTHGASSLGIDNSRFDNAVAYISPNMSGLTVTALYSLEVSGNELEDGDQNARAWALSPVYRNGPVMVGLNYHRVYQTNSAGTADRVETQWDLAASYDFGAVKLAAAYGRDTTDFDVANTDDAKVRQWFVGATVPVSAAGKVGVVYARQKDKSVDDSETKRWGVGYFHDLSKRTTAYAQYGRTTFEANSFDGPALGSTYRNVFGVGLQHRF